MAKKKRPVELQALRTRLDEVIGSDPELVRQAFHYGLGQLVLERGAATAIESNGDQVVLEDAGGAVFTLPRPALLTPPQEEMVKGHLGWLLRYHLP